MKKLNSTSKEKSKLFKNPILEFLTRAPYPVSFTCYLLLAASMFWLSISYVHFSALHSLILFAAGVFTWTFYEYLLHRFVFHYISDNKYVQRFHYLVHGVHHEFPRDDERITMPPLPGFIIGSILFGLHYLLLRDATFGFISGVFFGYNMYTLIHYATHAYKPVKGFKFWWTYHALHHFKYPDKAYGVSSPLWDIVFGTKPELKEKNIK